MASETDLFPLLSSDLDWRLAFSPSKANSLYEVKKLSNPTSKETPSLLFSDLPFFGGTNVGVTSRLGGGQTSIASEVLTHFPKPLASSPLSPESGNITLLAKRGHSLLAGNALSGEVMCNYNFGGVNRGLEPNSNSTVGLLGPVNKTASMGGFKPGSSPLVNANDVAMDWRELKLERELWRSADFLGQGLQSFLYRRRYYTNLFSPSTLINKVSI